MVEESSPQLPPAEGSIEAETDTALEAKPESGEPAPEPAGEPGFICDCEEWMRSACKGLPFYQEYGGRYCVLHYPRGDKIAAFKAALHNKLNRNDFDFRGVWFPDEVDFNGFRFSADAYFSKATFSAAADFSTATFGAAVDFSSVIFSQDTYFKSATFNGEADFSYATFNLFAYFTSATFRADANFSVATFKESVHFDSATFHEIARFSFAKFKLAARFSSAKFENSADFMSATFSAGAPFDSVTFKTRPIFMFAKFSADQDFSSTTFNSSASFIGATFKARADFNLRTINQHGDFRSAFFADAVSFFEHDILKAIIPGGTPSLNFEHARFERPNLVSFHTAALRPHWFVNVDPRRFVFTDVIWDWGNIGIDKEINALRKKQVASPHRLLEIACQQLADNAEANNRYGEASSFRYWTMELRRRVYSLRWHEKRTRAKMNWRLWWKRWSMSRVLKASRTWLVSKQRWRKRLAVLRSFGLTSLHATYWVVSGYGERISNALLTLTFIWLLFALMYVSAGFTDQIGLPRALTYSLEVMSLQKPDPRPLTSWAHALVAIETILGPVQGALLLLAIRRKFMR